MVVGKLYKISVHGRVRYHRQLEPAVSGKLLRYTVMTAALL
jgi:hypothetical protein